MESNLNFDSYFEKQWAEYKNIVTSNILFHNELHFYLLFFIFLYFSIHQQFKPLVVTTLIFLGLGQGLVEVSQYCNDDLAITIEGMGNLICICFTIIWSQLWNTFAFSWSWIFRKCQLSELLNSRFYYGWFYYGLEYFILYFK